MLWPGQCLLCVMRASVVLVVALSRIVSYSSVFHWLFVVGHVVARAFLCILGCARCVAHCCASYADGAVHLFLRILFCAICTLCCAYCYVY